MTDPNADAKHQARVLFPNIPEEIFTLWLDDRIEANGWPPITSVWDAAFRYKDLRFWHRLDWSKRTIKLDLQDFTRLSQEIINKLIEANFLGRPNDLSACMGDASRRKLKSILEYMTLNQTLPGSIILFRDGHLYEIVDGSHRLAAFFLFSQIGWQPLQEAEITCWIGEPHAS